VIPPLIGVTRYRTPERYFFNRGTLHQIELMSIVAGAVCARRSVPLVLALFGVLHDRPELRQPVAYTLTLYSPGTTARRDTSFSQFEHSLNQDKLVQGYYCKVASRHSKGTGTRLCARAGASRTIRLVRVYSAGRYVHAFVAPFDHLCQKSSKFAKTGSGQT